MSSFLYAIAGRRVLSDGGKEGQAVTLSASPPHGPLEVQAQAAGSVFRCVTAAVWTSSRCWR